MNKSCVNWSKNAWKMVHLRWFVSRIFRKTFSRCQRKMFELNHLKKLKYTDPFWVVVSFSLDFWSTELGCERCWIDVQRAYYKTKQLYKRVPREVIIKIRTSEFRIPIRCFDGLVLALARDFLAVLMIKFLSFSILWIQVILLHVRDRFEIRGQHWASSHVPK